MSFDWHSLRACQNKACIKGCGMFSPSNDEVLSETNPHLILRSTCFFCSCYAGQHLIQSVNTPPVGIPPSAPQPGTVPLTSVPDLDSAGRADGQSATEHIIFGSRPSVPLSGSTQTSASAAGPSPATSHPFPTSGLFRKQYHKRDEGIHGNGFASSVPRFDPANKV